jgi:hypothetical protein
VVATDAQGVTRIDIFVDGALVGSTHSQTSQGQSNLTGSQDWVFDQAGSHVITAQAVNAAGQVSNQAIVTIQAVADSANLPSTDITPGDTAIDVPAQPADDSQPDAPIAPPVVDPAQPPVILAFTAAPAAITSGQSTTIQWQVNGATQVGIEPGIGQVDLSGSKQVNPTTTTQYTLTAWSPDGSVTSQVTVQVNPASAVVKAWRGWDKPGGSFAGAPAVASRSANLLDVFVRGNNTHLMHRAWNGSAWSDWDDLGGELADSPACVSWDSKRIDCFVRGKNDSELWHVFWNGSKWSGWDKPGGAFAGVPAVASRSANLLDVFVRGNNTHLMHRAWNGSAWSDWEDLGGELADSPACVSWDSKRIDCFVRGKNDSELWHISWNGSKWSGWDKPGGAFAGAPAVASRSANLLDVFVRGNNTHLMHRAWNGSAWSDWEDLGGELADSPACVSWDSKRSDCFVRGKNDSELWHTFWSAN